MKSKVNIQKPKTKTLQTTSVPKDKLLHAGFSFILVLVAAPFVGLIWASIGVIILGVIKEVIDYYGPGHADLWDFVADMVGVVSAFMIASQVGMG